MNPIIIGHLFGGALPDGMTIRRHVAEPVGRAKAMPRTTPDLILAFVAAHPWAAAAKIAQSLGRPTNRLTGLLWTMVERGDLVRRGKLRHFEYNLGENHAKSSTKRK